MPFLLQLTSSQSHGIYQMYMQHTCKPSGYILFAVAWKTSGCQHPLTRWQSCPLRLQSLFPTCQTVGRPLQHNAQFKLLASSLFIVISITHMHLSSASLRYQCMELTVAVLQSCRKHRLQQQSTKCNTDWARMICRATSCLHLPCLQI
jgi:hypothetical protein